MNPSYRFSLIDPARLFVAAALLPALALLGGCAVTSVSAPSVAATSALQGRIIGGQQPVNGAAIALYAAGASGNRTGAVNLLRLPVSTAGDGTFSITSDYTCPSSATQVYLVASGGNPGLSPGTNNPASVMMAALGDCGNLSASTFIYVNEVTTVAAAWALAQFLGPSANIGASATNATGLRNAFLVANNLVDTRSGQAGGPSLPPGATFEPAKLYTLANVLATCINSDGGTPCNALFSAATVGASRPATTLDAVRNIVQNPASNIAAVFSAASAQGPFQPVLSKVPNDWTMSLTYTRGGLSFPTAIAVDSTGSVWAANYNGTSATKLSPAGLPAAATGFPDPSLHESYGLTIDGQDNVWITNEETSYQVNTGYGSVSKLSPGGQVLSGSGFTAGGIYYPYAIAADSNGSIWVSDYGLSRATILATDGSSLSGSQGFTSAGLSLPVAVAVDANHNGWFAGEGSVSKVTATGVITQFSCCRSPSAIAVDQSGAIWVTDYSASALVQLAPTGTLLQKLTSGGVFYPQSLAIDGNGAVWNVNYRGNSVSAFAPSTPGSPSSPLSPASGFGLDAPLGEPFGIALDASGNVWIANFAKDSLTQMVGLAAPIKTPLLGPPGQP